MTHSSCRWVRSCVMWNWLEYRKGFYDWGASSEQRTMIYSRCPAIFDSLFPLLTKYNMSSVIILAYTNSYYMNTSPINDTTRAAFVTYADAVVRSVRPRTDLTPLR